MEGDDSLGRAMSARDGLVAGILNPRKVNAKRRYLLCFSRSGACEPAARGAM